MIDKQNPPTWLLELRYMARASHPLFAGLLEEEDGTPRWNQDKELCQMMRNKWVSIVEGGFVITERGRRVCIKLLRDYGQPL
jgi:hypothetical protein